MSTRARNTQPVLMVAFPRPLRRRSLPHPLLRWHLLTLLVAMFESPYLRLLLHHFLLPSKRMPFLSLFLHQLGQHPYEHFFTPTVFSVLRPLLWEAVSSTTQASEDRGVPHLHDPLRQLLHAQCACPMVASSAMSGRRVVLLLFGVMFCTQGAWKLDGRS